MKNIATAVSGEDLTAKTGDVRKLTHGLVTTGHLKQNSLNMEVDELKSKKVSQAGKNPGTIYHERLCSLGILLSALVFCSAVGRLSYNLIHDPG